jgi:carboxyl-terminal processing protease
MALTTAKYYTPSGRLIQRDYSGSTFEYYSLNSVNVAPENPGQREIKQTDSGREVYGGGGITPDVIEPMRELNRFEGLLASRDVFFLYARRLTSGQAPSAGDFQLALKNIQNAVSSEKTPKYLPSLEISDAILDDFKAFLRDRNIDFTDEDIQNNVDFIKRRIKQVFMPLRSGFKRLQSSHSGRCPGFEGSGINAKEIADGIRPGMPAAQIQ